MTRAPYDPRRPLDGLTRRSFLAASGVLGAAAALAGCSSVTEQQVRDAAAATPLAGGTPILVLVTLYGGNDALNTLVPYAASAYHDARPELAWKDSDVLRLDDAYGLNPAMTGMHRLWQDKKLAIVRGVGYPKPDRSHFRSMDIWQTATPDAPVRSGWVGRWLDATGGDPMQALHIGSVLPVLAVGESRMAGALSAAEQRSASKGPDPLHALGMPDGADGAAAKAVVASYAAAERVRGELGGTAPGSQGGPGATPSTGKKGKAGATATPTPGASATTGAAGMTGEDDDAPRQAGEADTGGELGRQFDVVARCIRAGAPTRVYSTALGGFDTHAGEREAHKLLVGHVDAAITRLRGALADHDRGRDVVIMAYSEFGRRVKANASQGTDHGTAGTLFLIGDRVAGGFHGEQPSLTDLDNGDLKATTDFRSVYAELARRMLGADPGRIVPGAPTELGVLA